MQGRSQEEYQVLVLAAWGCSLMMKNQEEEQIQGGVGSEEGMINPGWGLLGWKCQCDAHGRMSEWVLH